MVARADLYLNRFDFGRVSLGLGVLLLLVLIVLVLAVIHDLGDRGIGAWRDLNEIQAGVVGFFQGFPQRDNANIGAVFTDDPEFRGLYLMIDANVCSQGSGLLSINNRAKI